MGVICFASLKGGVGKTSLSINVSDAFAKRGCETLLIDLDPTAHASRFFRTGRAAEIPRQAPLAKLFFSDGLEQHYKESESIVEFAAASGVELCIPVRPRLHVIPASPELRYFMWGRGAQFFGSAFAKLLSELSGMYDSIVIDTPPDFNVVTRNAIAVADIVAVPVDSSEMSIHCLEEIVSNAAHILGPRWVIARTMVNRQASRVQQLSNERLNKNFQLGKSEPDPEFGVEDWEEDEDIEEASQFIQLLRKRESVNGVAGAKTENGVGGHEPSERRAEEPAATNQEPIYLLNSMIYRTEQQNRLTFTGRTAFDDRSTAKLAEQYLGVARELEEIITLVSPKESALGFENFVPNAVGLAE